MPSYRLLAACLFAAFCFAFSSGDQPLEISTIFAPAACQAEDARRAKVGDSMEVQFTVTVLSTTFEGKAGDVIDSTYSSDSPFHFRLGATGLLPGWDEAVKGLCVGEKRRVVFPSSSGTRPLMSGRGKPIPRGATLQVDIEFERFIDPPSLDSNFFEEMDTDQDKKVTKAEMEEWFRVRHPRKRGTLPNGIWERQDQNKDGFVTWEEFRGPKGKHPSGEL